MKNVTKPTVWRAAIYVGLAAVVAAATLFLGVASAFAAAPDAPYAMLIAPRAMLPSICIPLVTVGGGGCFITPLLDSGYNGAVSHLASRGCPAKT